MSDERESTKSAEQNTLLMRKLPDLSDAAREFATRDYEELKRLGGHMVNVWGKVFNAFMAGAEWALSARNASDFTHLNRHEEFKRAYDEYPSQDNDGYVPDRGGFKCGFMAAWDVLLKALTPGVNKGDNGPQVEFPKIATTDQKDTLLNSHSEPGQELRILRELAHYVWNTHHNVPSLIQPSRQEQNLYWMALAWIKCGPTETARAAQQVPSMGEAVVSSAGVEAPTGVKGPSPLTRAHGGSSDGIGGEVTSEVARTDTSVVDKPLVDAACEYAKKGTVPEFIGSGPRPEKEKIRIAAFLAGAYWREKESRPATQDTEWSLALEERINTLTRMWKLAVNCIQDIAEGRGWNPGEESGDCLHARAFLKRENIPIDAYRPEVAQHDNKGDGRG